MSFIKVKNFLSNNLHTILLILGLILIVSAITLLTSVYFGLLALGVFLIWVAWLINKEWKGG